MSDISAKQLEAAVVRIVGEEGDGELSLKGLRRRLETDFKLEKRGLDSRKDEIREYVVKAMEGGDQPDKSGGRNKARGRGRTNVGDLEEPVWVSEPEDCRGKDRSGQQPDFSGFLKKKGDKGRIKMWSKRHFRLYKDEGVLAYFKKEGDSVQLGEIMVKESFLIENRDDIGKFVFAVTMKTTARIWWLQGKDAAERDTWMNQITPLMKVEEDAAAEILPGTIPKPPLGNPLKYPPTYVQGWTEIEDCLATIQDPRDWTGLIPKVEKEEAKDGDVAVTIHGKCGTAVIEETRALNLDANGEIFIEDLPKQLKDTVETINWASEDSSILQNRFIYDEKNQKEILKKLVGRQVEASVPSTLAGEGSGSLNFPASATFTGVVHYHQEDDSYALVDEKDNTIHFLETGDAKSLKLLEDKVTEISEGTTDAFSKPRLWSKFKAEGVANGKLSYHLKDAFDLSVNYSVVLEDDEKNASVNGWYSIENNSGKTYNQATVSVLPNPKAAEEKAKEEGEDTVEEKVEEEVKKGIGGKLGGLASLLKKKDDKPEKPKEPRIYRFPVVQNVTLPKYEQAQATFLSQKVATRAQHLVSFDTPSYQIKPVVGEEVGADSAVNVQTVLRFSNPLDSSIPAGAGKVDRREKSGRGARNVCSTSIPRVESGEEVTVVLGDASGITATRVQTGFNFDALKHFIIETYEITIVNGRQQQCLITVEESLWRWSNSEITSSWPPHQATNHPRKIKWNLKMNHGEDVTIKYTAFYSTFDLDSDYEER